MNTKDCVSCLLIATLLLVGGCGKGQPVQDTSPQGVFNEVAAALAGFKDRLAAEEELFSEDVIAGLGEVSGGLNQLIELCADRPELQPVLKSMQETLNQMQNDTQLNIDKARLRQGIAKLEEQCASLRQQLSSQ